MHGLSTIHALNVQAEANYRAKREAEREEHLREAEQADLAKLAFRPALLSPAQAELALNAGADPKDVSVSAGWPQESLSNPAEVLRRAGERMEQERIEREAGELTSRHTFRSLKADEGILEPDNRYPFQRPLVGSTEAWEATIALGWILAIVGLGAALAAGLIVLLHRFLESR